MANTSILAAFERMWQHVANTYATKIEVPEVVEDCLSDLGAITIDLEDSTEGTVAGINADSVGGLTEDDLVTVNLTGIKPGEEDTIIGLNAVTFGGEEPGYYASKAWVNELIGGLANAAY